MLVSVVIPEHRSSIPEVSLQNRESLTGRRMTQWTNSGSFAEIVVMTKRTPSRGEPNRIAHWLACGQGCQTLVEIRSSESRASPSGVSIGCPSERQVSREEWSHFGASQRCHPSRAGTVSIS